MHVRCLLGRAEEQQFYSPGVYLRCPRHIPKVFSCYFEAALSDGVRLLIFLLYYSRLSHCIVVETVYWPDQHTPHRNSGVEDEHRRYP